VQPLDVTRIKDWDKIFPAFKKLPGVTMPDGKHYMLPVDAGVTGMVYDPSKVSPAPTSFIELFNPKYAGHVTIIDYPVTAIQIGALALGYTDPAHLTDEQLANVEKLYIEAKKRGQFRTFYNNDSELVNLFKTGEIYFAVGGRGDTLNIKGEGVPVAFSLANNGQMLWTCGYGISSTCQNVDAAYALLNYYLSPQAEGYEATKWNYMVANMDALKAVSAKVREAAGLAEPNNFGNVLPAAPPPEGYDKWIRAWQEVKRS
jgi:spermidine/putrescine-binding protein